MQYASMLQIQFGNLRSIPERDKSAFPVACGQRRYGIGSRHRAATGKIESMQYLAVGGIHQQGIIGEVISNQQTIAVLSMNDGQSRRKGVGHSGRQLCVLHLILLLSIGQLLKRNRQQALFGDAIRVECIDENSISRCDLLVGQGVGQRSDTYIEMFAIATESEPGE